MTGLALVLDLEELHGITALDLPIWNGRDVYEDVVVTAPWTYKTKALVVIPSLDGPLLALAITAGYGPCESSEEQVRELVRGLVLAYTATEEASQQHGIGS